MSQIKCMTKELMLAMAPACLLVEYFFGIMWLYDEMMALFHSPLTSIFVFYFGVYLLCLSSNKNLYDTVHIIRNQSALIDTFYPFDLYTPKMRWMYTCQ